MLDTRAKLKRLREILESDEGKGKPSNKEALDLLRSIEADIPELDEGTSEFAAVHMFVEKDGKRLGYAFVKDACVKDKTVALSMLDIATTILIKDDAKGREGNAA